MRVKWMSWGCGWISVLAIAGMVSCSAHFAAWNGRWKLDEKSQVVGPSFSITMTPSGEYQFQNGTGIYKFRCADGKDYPSVGQLSVACVADSPTTMDTVSKDNGKKVWTTHRELSADGKTLTESGVVIHADGATETVKRVYLRGSGSTGFTGAWRNADRSGGGAKLLVTTVTGSVLRLAYPEAKQFTDMRLDGTDALTHFTATQGSSNPMKVTLAVRPEGSLKLLTTKKVDGRIVNEGTLTISGDGRYLIEEWWSPENPKGKARRVYDRQ